MTEYDGWLVDQLPNVLGSDPLARRYVGMLESIATGIRKQADGVDRYFDVSVAPPEFVRWMGLWLGVTVPAGLDEVRQRDLVSEAGPLIPWRGTRSGLQSLLEAVTGAGVTIKDTGKVLDEPRKRAIAKHVVVEVTDTGAFTEQQLLALVRAEIPADATADLLVSGREIEQQATDSNEPAD
jgi:phage tail-like protein